MGFRPLGWSCPMVARVTQTPRHVITGTGKQLTVRCSQDMNHDAMYWYRQDPGLGLKLIYYSRNVDFIEKGDVLDGYAVSQKEERNFPLTLESTSTSQTPLYLCASSKSSLHKKRTTRARRLLPGEPPPPTHTHTSRRKIPSTISVGRSPSLTPHIRGP
uniref:Ig-like domain-containing protein n=1 Tax=Panthera leo TaxID=9689 RepID=A0A8C8X6Q3_PANLE